MYVERGITLSAFLVLVSLWGKGIFHRQKNGMEDAFLRDEDER